ncbi:MAG: hypothetical protein LT067_06465 [Sulfurovum sp.]|nr:hypothetical protein [Sulfurovum sp.]
MKSIQEILKNTISSKERKERAKKEKQKTDDFKRTIVTGSGEKPDKLKMYNKYIKKYGHEPITAREYLKDQETLDHEIDLVLYEINCTNMYINDVFGVDIELDYVAAISDKIFQEYYEGGNEHLEHASELYPKILHAISHAHEISPTKLIQTKQTLINLGIKENDIPLELTIAIHIREKYAENQKRQALKDILIKLLPEINNKIILEKIATNAL